MCFCRVLYYDTHLKPVLDKLFRLKYLTKRCTLLNKLEYINTK
ncbi:hypothetical protein T09_4090 [Trichinella sp. T9]|nr:hypothetical protein T09_4090 [Trichinella sp. T9]